MRYVGMPVLCVQTSEVAAAPPDAWPLRHDGLGISFRTPYRLSQPRNDSSCMPIQYWGLRMPSALYDVPSTGDITGGSTEAKRTFTGRLVAALTCNDIRLQDGDSTAYFFLSPPLRREGGDTEMLTDQAIDIVDNGLRRLSSCTHN